MLVVLVLVLVLVLILLLALLLVNDDKTYDNNATDTRTKPLQDIHKNFARNEEREGERKGSLLKVKRNRQASQQTASSYGI